MSVKQIGLSGLCWLLCGLGWLRAQGPVTDPPGPITAPPGDHGLLLNTPYRDAADSMSPFNPAADSQGGSGGPLGSAFVRAPAGKTPDGIAIDEGSPPIPPPEPIPLGRPLDPYLNYARSPCCCGNVGKCGGPFGSELFIRSGWAFPVGGGIFNQFLHAGWDIEGGGKLFLFNAPMTAAWTGTVSISNIFARTGTANQSILLTNVAVHVPPPNTLSIGEQNLKVVPELMVSVSSLNLTFVNLGFGREWWLCGSADPGQTHGFNWRAGFDFGGRWGSADVQFNEITHRTHVAGGMYGAGYTNVEWPFRCGIPFAGIRLEYNYIWDSILQDRNDGDFSSINLLLQLGVRF